MALDSEMLRYLTLASCNKVDKLIDLLPDCASEQDWRDVNDCINSVLKHVHARSAQTSKPPFLPDNVGLYDLIAQPAENPPAISATDAELNALLGL